MQSEPFLKNGSTKVTRDINHYFHHIELKKL